MAKNNPKKTVSKGAPKLDRFIRPEKQKQYVTYAQAAGYFSLPYYTTVNLAKRANANLHIRKAFIYKACGGQQCCKRAYYSDLSEDA